MLPPRVAWASPYTVPLPLLPVEMITFTGKEFAGAGGFGDGRQGLGAQGGADARGGGGEGEAAGRPGRQR